MVRCPNGPTIYFAKEADVPVNVHVDDGNGCGPAAGIKNLIAYIRILPEIKFFGVIGSGSQYQYLRQ